MKNFHYHFCPKCGNHWGHFEDEAKKSLNSTHTCICGNNSSWETRLQIPSITNVRNLKKRFGFKL